MSTKRLLFHFFAFRGMEDFISYHIHMKCLEHYCHVFNEAIFVICVNDTNDTELIHSVESSLMNMGYDKNVKFIVKENTPFQESDTFYNELALKLGDYDGLTFFGHTKGFGNEMEARSKSSKITMEDMEKSIFYWIVGLYYFCLSNIEEIENYLYHTAEPTSYGAFKTKRDDIDTKYKWIYSGTFMWLNTQKLKHIIYLGKEKLPPFYNRYYSEQFCSEVIPFNDSRSFMNAYVANCGNFYTETLEMIYAFLLYNDDEINKFKTFYEEMRK